MLDVTLFCTIFLTALLILLITRQAGWILALQTRAATDTRSDARLLRVLAVPSSAAPVDPQTQAFQIRPATPADCAGIAKVQVDSYCTSYAGFFPQSYFQNFSYAEQEQDWRNWFASENGEILLVAVSAENEVLGYALARAKAEIYPGYASELAALHVRKALQSQGIGKALLLNAVQHLAARGCQTVMLWTLQGNPVRRWYERLQGKLLGETNYDVDGWNIVEVAYGWEIKQLAG